MNFKEKLEDMVQNEQMRVSLEELLICPKVENEENPVFDMQGMVQLQGVPEAQA